MTVSKNGYTTLHKIRELGEVEVAVLLTCLPEFDVQNAVNSLKRGGLIKSVRLVNRQFTDSRSTRTYPVSVYTVTDRGYTAMEKYEAAETRKKAVANPPSFRKITPKPQKQELYQMQNWVIPERDPNVDVTYVKIAGQEQPVKVTYGVGHPYASLKLAPDLTRYKRNVIKGIHAT